MKYIEKKIQNEPATLKEYRKTPNATYSGFGDKDQLLKKVLLEEQGYICAYCNGRISLDLNANKKPKIEVEHYASQSDNPNADLDYKNMLGVCNGITREKNEHCDKSKKKEALNVLNPINKSVEKNVTYSLKGKLLAVAENKKVKADIDLLNLNDHFLVGMRKQVMDDVLKGFIKNHPERQWTKYLFEKEIEKWQARHKGKYRPYCMAAIWFLELLKNKKQYPEK